MDPSTELNDLSPEALLERAAEGNEDALSELFRRFRGRLKRMVGVRMHPRLRGRMDDSDIVQDAFVEAARRLSEYLEDPRAPFFLWLRQIVGHKLIDAHRRHLLSRQRDAHREVPLYRGSPQASSASLAAQLLGGLTSPSRAAIKEETRQRVRAALEDMNEIAREVLTLRHFERLSNVEAAALLDIDPSACSNRYVRAVQRLKKVIDDPGDEP